MVMAIQAQCAPPNVLLLNNRADDGAAAFHLPQGVLPCFMNPSTVMLPDGGGTMNPRKQEPETAALPMTMGASQSLDCGVSDLLFLQRETPPLMFVNLAQLQSNSSAPLVSTGLQLAFEAGAPGEQFPTVDALQPSLFEEELTRHLTQYQAEVDAYLHAQGEVLRRAVEVKWKSHSRNLLREAKAVAQTRIRAKDMELQQSVRKGALLEERLARLRVESAAWQARAVAAQSQVFALQAQLRRLAEETAVAREREDETGGQEVCDDDAASAACVQTETTANPLGSCRLCRRREAAAEVVVLPCRHLCMCVDCAANGFAQSCPACGRVTTDSVHVAFG